MFCIALCWRLFCVCSCCRTGDRVLSIVSELWYHATISCGEVGLSNRDLVKVWGVKEWRSDGDSVKGWGCECERVSISHLFCFCCDCFRCFSVHWLCNLYSLLKRRVHGVRKTRGKNERMREEECQRVIHVFKPSYLQLMRSSRRSLVEYIAC